MSPRWLPERAVRAMHVELLAEHGGLEGAVDENLLGATLARPRQLEAYGDPPPGVPRLAAAYGFGFCRNHCFQDGNKRVALAAMDVFLQLNGLELTAPEEEAAFVIERLAEGEFTEEELADWVSGWTQPLR